MHLNPWGLDPVVLQSILSGQSVVDMPRLAIRSLDQGNDFLLNYGFDYQEPAQEERLWYFHRRALVYLSEVLDIELKQIPPVLQDRKTLQDFRRLLLFASSRDDSDKELQRWSCRILRVIHVFVHAESDLFTSFSEEIQRQVLTPIQETIFTDGASAKTFLKAKTDEGETIPLHGFEIKPFKSSTSTVTKLLAKPDAYAMNVLDRMGVRFITSSVLDSYRVIQFLIQQNLISFPHIMPDQSVNTIYPVSHFLKALDELKAENYQISEAEVEKHFQAALTQAAFAEGSFLKRENSFSGEDYRFIKLIARRLVRVKPESSPGEFPFFFPFEVQILDAQSYLKIQEGPSRHQAYKQRQREAARSRVLAEQGAARI
jgi:uncharacterized protein (TIGR04562 family)